LLADPLNEFYPKTRRAESFGELLVKCQAATDRLMLWNLVFWL
jgi:hypothetical protein